MLTLLASVLPNFLLNGLKTWQEGRVRIATSEQLTKRETGLATINGVIEGRREQAGVIKQAMGHKVFWVVWSIFAFPLAIWWALGMADTIANGTLPDVAAIPASMRPYADAIFDNIFYTGAGMGGVQVLERIARNYRR